MKTSIQTTLLIALLSCSAIAQSKADPYTSGSAKPKQAEPSPAQQEGPVNISTRVEVFSMPLVKAAGLQRQNLSDAECYKNLVEMTSKGEAQQEYMTVVRSRSGEETSNEAIVEQIYPTEHDLVFVSSPIEGAEDAEEQEGDTDPKQPGVVPANMAYYPSNPTAYETRNTGESLDVACMLLEGQRYCSLRLFSEQVKLVGYSEWGQGATLAKMPTYETRRVNSTVTCEIGKPFLFGTFNRPTVAAKDNNPELTTSFTFITVSIAH